MSVNVWRARAAMVVLVGVGIALAWTINRWPGVFTSVSGAPGLLALLLFAALGVWLDRWIRR